MTIHKCLALDVIINQYKQHQQCVRGLREVTLHDYKCHVRAKGHRDARLKLLIAAVAHWRMASLPGV